MRIESTNIADRSKRLRLILVGLFFVLMFTYAGVNAFQALTYSSSYPGWVRQANSKVYVKYVLPDGPVGELQPGDEVLKINGLDAPHETAAIGQGIKPLARLAPDTPYKILIRRNGATFELTLRTIQTPLSILILRFVLTVIVPLSALVLGLIVFVLQPFDKKALLMALAFGLFIPPLALGWTDNLPLILAGIVKLGVMITPLFFVFFLHFFLVFPERSPLLRRYPRLEWLIYIPFTAVVLPFQVERLMGEQDLLYLAATVCMSLYFVASCLLLIINYRAVDEAAKRKLRVTLAGMLFGGLPGIFYFFFIAPLFDIGRFSSALAQWLPVAAAAVLPLVFFAFAYAIARHRVIPVSLMIRRSVQYLLAKNALRALLALPIIGILLTIISNPNRTVSELLFRNSISFYLLAAISATLGLLFRKRVSRWIDRKFFRETYDQEKILRELIDEVKKLDSIPEMSKRVTERVGAALHPKEVYLFYREEEGRNLSLSYTSGGTSREIKIPEEFQLLRFMELQGSTEDFPFPQKNNLPAEEKEWLARLDTRLIVPMSGTDNRLSGLLLFGEKKSDVPYTKNDRQLLENLAGQIAIVYENVRLKNRVDHDRKIKHEVLSRIAEQNLNLLKECPRCGSCHDMNVQNCERDGAELTLSLPVERTIEGRYRLDRLIGKGGMGAVYQATDARLQRKVAVKILTGSMFGNRDALRRFEREAQTSARLQHANIIRIHDYGVLSTEGAYLVMELITGETLAARLKRKGQMPTELAADIFRQILEGIRAAHTAGVVHRDLKPENVLLAREDRGRLRAHILDFGLAKLTQAIVSDSQSPTVAQPVTTPGAVMGTFGYMSPEQLTGEVVDERSDLFSIGVMVVEALTGRKPFAGRTYHELLTEILHNSFHLEGELAETKRLDAVLQKCLAKDMSERFTSAAAMQSALIPAIRNCSSFSLQLEKLVELDADTAII